MDVPTLIGIVGATLGVFLLAYALTRRPRGPGPPARRSRDAVERWWDTPEHSEAWEEEDEEERRRAGRR